MSIDEFVSDLPGEPGYEVLHIRDRNRLVHTIRKRTISNPNNGMREVHKRIIRYLRDLKVPLPHATGAVIGGSPIVNVSHHLYSRFFYITDISNAYYSVDLDRLVDVLCLVDPELESERTELLRFLQNYCSRGFGGLIIGFPASPDLFNLYAGVLIDRPLGELAAKHSMVYTRYLDDLVFSSSKPIGKVVRRRIRETIAQAGLKISHRKSRVLDLTVRPIVVNGIGLEWGDGYNRIFLPRHFTRRINGILLKAISRGNIRREKVTGYMGVFVNTLSVAAVNSTESRVLENYRKWKEVEMGWKKSDQRGSSGKLS